MDNLQKRKLQNKDFAENFNKSYENYKIKILQKISTKVMKITK